MKTLVREDQRQLNNGQVVNATTLDRWGRQARVAALLRPFRTQVSRARKKREARLANRKKLLDLKRTIHKLAMEIQNADS